MTLALDPFHDVTTTASGMPDTSTSASITQVVNRSYQLSHHGGSTANWCAHVFTTPDLIPMIGQAGLVVGSSTYLDYYLGSPGVAQTATVPGTYYSPGAEGVKDVVIGPLTIWQWDTDVGSQPLYPDPAVGPFGKPSVMQADCPITGVAGQGPGIPQGNAGAPMMRCIGMGVEIINTTPQLYIGGTVTVSRVPSKNVYDDLPALDESVEYGTATGTHYITAPHPCFKCVSASPPSSIANALSTCPNARQWNAKDGCYMTCTFDSTQNPFAQPRHMGRAFANGTLNPDYPGIGDYTTANNSNVIYFREVGLAPGDNHVLGKCFSGSFMPMPFDISSCILSGLVPQSTFTINVRYVFEIAPVISDPYYGALSLSTAPSPLYDPESLLLYQKAAALLPPGVQSTMNPSGEFWSGVVDVLGTLAGGALGGVARVAAPLINKAVSYLGGYDDAVVQKEKTKVTRAREAVARNPRQTPTSVRMAAVPSMVGTGARARASSAGSATSGRVSLRSAVKKGNSVKKKKR